MLTGQIRRIQAANVVIPNTPPRPYVAAYPPAGNVGLKSPLTVQFSSDGTYDQENDAFWVHWDFGYAQEISWNFHWFLSRDGGYSNEANPVHNFTTSGSFTVRLTVIDSNMNSAFKEMTYISKLFIILIFLLLYLLFLNISLFLILLFLFINSFIY